ncbi:hypothetical protein VZT92_026320 [Zoarces viviparus]|uniref:Uncharacterized protein n=1 Tax=Zoarces viviparus TaxID=48416 RepID=A0AAW1E0J3_ZOAVI
MWQSCGEGASRVNQCGGRGRQESEMMAGTKTEEEEEEEEEEEIWRKKASHRRGGTEAVLIQCISRRMYRIFVTKKA